MSTISDTFMERFISVTDELRVCVRNIFGAILVSSRKSSNLHRPWLRIEATPYIRADEKDLP